jgi:hypothetical protein
MKKLLYVCLDGLGDDPIPEFDGRTPLEAAVTPAMDSLAARGRTGVVVTVGDGIAPESDIAVFAILGYDPRGEHPGRGVVEAVGTDMDFEDGDLAYRVNFATCEWPQIIDRRVGRDLSSDEAAALAQEVNDTLVLPGATFTLKATVEHRGSLLIRAAEGRLSADVTNTDPAYRKDGSLGVALETFEPVVAHCEPLSDSDEAHHAAELTNRFVEESAKILDVGRQRRASPRVTAANASSPRRRRSPPVLQSIDDRFGRRVLRGMRSARHARCWDTAVPAPTWSIDVRWMSPSRVRGMGAAAVDALAGYDALRPPKDLTSRHMAARRGQARRHLRDRRRILLGGPAFPRPHDHDRRGDGRSLNLVRPEGTHGGSRPAPGERRRGAVRRFHVVRRARVCRRGAGASPRYRYLAPAGGPDAYLSPR